MALKNIYIVTSVVENITWYKEEQQPGTVLRMAV